MKPRIRFNAITKVWQCHSWFNVANGATPKEAYRAWMGMFDPPLSYPRTVHEMPTGELRVRILARR